MTTSNPDAPEMPEPSTWRWNFFRKLTERDQQWQAKLDTLKAARQEDALEYLSLDGQAEALMQEVTALKADIVHKDAWGEQLSQEFMRHRLASQQTISALSEAAERLQAENEALRKDAERYRWLRDLSVPPHNFYLSVPVEFHGVRYGPAEVDAAIDAAINPPKEGT